MADCNKTDLTRQITDAASRWLDEKGFKPVETEVYAARGWIADLAAVGSLTRTEAVKLKVIPKAPKHSTDWRERQNAWEAMYQSLPRLVSTIVEVKVSKSDFTGDRKWGREPVANLMYVAMPPGLRERVDVPPPWGILQQVGDQVRCMRPAILTPVPVEQTLWVTHSIAVRRDHFTRYARFREFDRQARQQRGEETTVARVSTICRAVLGLATGRYRTVDEALGSCYVRVKVPGYVRKELEKLIPPPVTEAQPAINLE